ncbi:Inosine/uridine-preferring nucleoside hydrolase [Nadsonia fulvescens var. elongata DSM 6958]|uniref:Inosine/uridine-preferring nucleoside hydrolase n=1 Tax=Nadsonia fulvescens var. elongata DSM 6958 TaxID=857566 RepID=A0A1E3PFI1_9ASCO|nr:Inosine/uridine-preferring nucleoside hydrolase [Nadsonia fulvescens var. elongata DSM 6958]
MTINNTGSTSHSIPLWLDCDPGHDDAMAIYLSLFSPFVNLLGISTVYGNAPLAKTTANTLSLLTAVGKSKDIKVYPGAYKPLFRPVSHAPTIHGESGLDGTKLLPIADDLPMPQGTAIQAMANAINQNPNEITVVATGTLTNIASLIAEHPEVLEKIKYISIMGGGINEGNWSDYAEFNIWCDPEAAKIVLTNDIIKSKVVMVPINLTHQAIATKSILKRVLYGNSSPPESSNFRLMLHELLKFFATTYEEQQGFLDGPPVHDPLAIACLFSLYGLDENVPDHKKINFEFTRYKIDVIQEGYRIGETVEVKLDEQDGVLVGKKMNIPGFWNVFLDAVEKADKVSKIN